MQAITINFFNATKSLYVDKESCDLKTLQEKLDHLQQKTTLHIGEIETSNNDFETKAYYKTPMTTLVSSILFKCKIVTFLAFSPASISAELL